MNFSKNKIENFERMKTERDSDKCVLADLPSSQESKFLPMTSCSMLFTSDVDLLAWHGRATFIPECRCVKPEDNRDPLYATTTIQTWHNACGFHWNIVNPQCIIASLVSNPSNALIRKCSLA